VNQSIKQEMVAMRRRKLRSVQLTVMMSAAALAAAACGSSSNSASASSGGVPKGQTVVEGVVTAFTGPESFIGGVLTAGVYPAVYEINQAGGVLGHQFKAVTVDTRGDPADALPLVERFLGSQSNLVGITGTDGATVNQLVPLINSHSITITSQAGSAAFDRSSYQYYWRSVPPDAANGLAIALWAKKQGYNRIALVFGTDTTAQTDLPGIEYGAKNLHLTIVDNAELTPDQASYQSDAAKLLAAHPQVIMTEEDATTAGTFFGELAQLGRVPPVIGDSGTVQGQWINAVSSAIGKSNFAKLYTAVTIQSPNPTPANSAMNSALEHVSSQVVKPVSQWFGEPYAESAYDGVILQALAMLAAHSVKPSVYNSYIQAVSEPGPGKVQVYTFAQGKSELAAGKKIQYIGAEGPIVFNQYHNYYGNQVAAEFPTGQMSSEKVLYVVPAAQLEAAG
jgi:ABC-type branched-subunit amino acid transport system substrate-binding protein